jgi:membrane fusion protein, type I secretion system
MAGRKETGPAALSREPGAPFSRRLIVIGFFNFGVFLAVLAAWSWLAPVKSAVIAPGLVSVDSYRKKIQHLEGGIIDQILVREGDLVKPGQLLVRMRDVAQAATVARLRAQYYEALAIAAQSAAERDGLEELSFPEELTSAEHPAAVAAMAAQKNVFDSQLHHFEHTLSAFRQKTLQTEEEVRGLRGLLSSLEKQLKHFDSEVGDAQHLFTKDLMAKSKLSKLMRESEESRGERSKVTGQIAQKQQQILELELKMTELRSARVATAVERLREHQAKIYEFSQLLVAAEDVMRRTKVRSPIEGTVVDVQVHTRDGVIAPGQTLMEVVPAGDRLIVEGRLRPEDREEVRAGLETYVQLTTQGRRDPRPLRGRLESISADRLVDKDQQQPYYRVRINLDPASVQQQGVEVLAGMGADVFIQTGERTPIQYMLSPVVRSLDRGLREQ